MTMNDVKFDRSSVREALFAYGMGKDIIGGVVDNLVKAPTIKTCLKCGAKHTHHNSFCSAECCKTYKL